MRSLQVVSAPLVFSSPLRSRGGLLEYPRRPCPPAPPRARPRPQPDLLICNTYNHITWYADAWGHDLSPHQKLRSHDLYFMVEWFQLSLRSDISSGKTWLRIIRLGLWMRLGESVSNPPKLGHFDPHFMHHWLRLSFPSDSFPHILCGLLSCRLVCRCVFGSLSASHPN